MSKPAANPDHRATAPQHAPLAKALFGGRGVEYECRYCGEDVGERSDGFCSDACAAEYVPVVGGRRTA